MLGFLPNVHLPEMIIILVVVLLFFGATKLPGLARSLGASAKEFKKGVSEGVAEDDIDVEDSST